MRINLTWVFVLLAPLIFFHPQYVTATEKVTGCDNRYATLVNPVRGRDLWVEKSVNPLKDQYNLIKQYNFLATWLLQYDALIDKELLDEIKAFDKDQEKGVFLEVSQKLADDARVIYPHAVPWYSPKAVFLSAYTQSERRRIIDKLFNQFKIEFGHYPKSVGAWWIDSYSLSYLKNKYDIKAAMIVADQKATDNYGVWGQWWGVPYYPSKANILIPATNLKNKQNVVILQWAQRDPELAVGEGPKFSNYSLQANDYIRQGKKTDYFQSLINIYLDCQNPVGQVTVGLETGSDSVVYFEEYAKQLEVLQNTPNLQMITMNEFYEKFSQVYQNYPKEIIIESGNSRWVMNPQKRVNESIDELTLYNPEKSFDDYYIPRKDEFLNRILPSEVEQSGSNLVVSPGFMVLVILGIFSFFRKKFKIWIVSTFSTLASFGLVLRSYSQFGWWVYYGPTLQPLYLYQIVLPIISYFSFVYLERFKNLKLWVIPLAFAVDPLIQNFRVSLISEKYLIGFLLDSLRFAGISFSKNYQLEFVNADLPGYLAQGLLKFDFARIWQNLPNALIIYPLIHTLLGIVLGLMLKKSLKTKKLIIPILFFFFLVYLWMIFNADPFAVQSFR